MAEAGHGVSSEVGRLRTVMLHRPGEEIRRLTPRNNDELLFDGVPWVDRAQDEHDAFADALRARGVEVLYLRELLIQTLAIPAARDELLDGALRPEAIGPTLATTLREHLYELGADELAGILIAGMAHGELPVEGGLVDRMSGPLDFIIRPLPNVLFTRDSSVWLQDGVAVTQLALGARRRETTLTGAIYTHHPRFAGTQLLYGGTEREDAWLEGGDVLVLAPGAARAVLAVPISQERATMHLDTVCTMVDRDAVVMYPLLADTLVAHSAVADPDGGLEVSGPEPFLVAAARAMEIDALRVIDTGLDPVTA